MNGQTLTEAHVQWRMRPSDQRFETLEALAEKLNARRLRSRSTEVDKNDVLVSDQNGVLVVNSQIQASEPSHWAFGQLCQASKLNGVTAPSAYLRQLPTPLAVQCLNEGLRNGARESHKFMTIASDGNEPATLQAVTSTSYGRIWDADVVAAVQRIRERTGGKFYNPKAIVGGEVKPSGLYASDHDVFIFMIDGGSILDAGPRAQLNRGFIVWNSETGAKTFGLMTFIFNQCCGNHFIYGAQDITKLVIRHCAHGPYRFDSEASPMLLEYANASAEPVLNMAKKAQDLLLPPADALPEWVDRHGKFNRGEITNAIAFAKSEEGECRTLWQLVQGFTAYARGFDFIDARVDLEKRASALLHLVD